MDKIKELSKKYIKYSINILDIPAYKYKEINLIGKKKNNIIEYIYKNNKIEEFTDNLCKTNIPIVLLSVVSVYVKYKLKTNEGLALCNYLSQLPNTQNDLHFAPWLRVYKLQLEKQLVENQKME